jgi:hypothetical protein
MGRYNYSAKFSDLLGKTLTDVKGGKGDETLTFVCDDGTKYTMQYFDDCCASCNIEDICGDLGDLVGSPIVRAEDPSSLDNFDPDAEAKRAEGGSYSPESYTWTFYIIGTAKGTVTIRWYGSSNGYYSESPTFYLDDEND